MNRLRKKYSSEFVDLNNFIKAFETNDGKKIYRIIGGPFHKRNSALAKINLETPVGCPDSQHFI